SPAQVFDDSPTSFRLTLGMARWVLALLVAPAVAYVPGTPGTSGFHAPAAPSVRAEAGFEETEGSSALPAVAGAFGVGAVLGWLNSRK
ncbi:unnamed protein product, partial [Effrenium voratum]